MPSNTKHLWQIEMSYNFSLNNINNDYSSNWGNLEPLIIVIFHCFWDFDVIVCCVLFSVSFPSSFVSRKENNFYLH